MVDCCKLPLQGTYQWFEQMLEQCQEEREEVIFKLSPVKTNTAKNQNCPKSTAGKILGGKKLGSLRLLHPSLATMNHRQYCHYPQHHILMIIAIEMFTVASATPASNTVQTSQSVWELKPASKKGRRWVFWLLNCLKEKTKLTLVRRDLMIIFS